MNYEEKMNLLAWVRPEKKDELLLRIIRGEKVDITKDEDLFYQVNKDRVSLDEFVNRDKFITEAELMKQNKQILDDPVYGKSKGKKFRYLGDIPAEVYFSRPEFSPLLDKKERDNNVRKFLNTYTVFKAGDKRV